MSEDPVYVRVSNPSERVRVVSFKMQDILFRNASGKGGIRCMTRRTFGYLYKRETEK